MEVFLLLLCLVCLSVMIGLCILGLVIITRGLRRIAEGLENLYFIMKLNGPWRR